jgi:DNA adenine methylase
MVDAPSKTQRNASVEECGVETDSEARSVTAHPFLKWAGGKTALLHEILPRLPKKIGTYYEPFVGGGAVFFALAFFNGRFKRAVIGDTNRELMQTYEAVAVNVEGVIKRLKEHVYDEKRYYAVRAQCWGELQPLAQAARFIYLNRTCFNGLYRVNRQGKFNVPFGHYTNPTICDEENLRAVSHVLRDVSTFTSLDFQNTVLTAERGDAVYFDPPYVPVSETANFTAYSAGGFGPEDQKRLHKVATDLAVRGVHVLLSNSDTPLVRKLYKGFKIERVEAPRRVNSKASKRGNVGELLISGRNQ